MSDKILVTGASGQQGGAVARSLLSQGKSVRVLSRSNEKVKELKKQGAEVAIGNLEDRASLDAALKGVRRAFLVTTPFEKGTESEAQQGIRFVDAAKDAGIEHLVFSSVVNPDPSTRVPLFASKGKVIAHIREVSIPATILKPVWFMENFGTIFLPALQAGKLSLPLPNDYVLDMVSLDVIGAFGTAAFLRPSEFIGKTVEVASDSLTLTEVVRQISEAFGKTIGYEELPADQAEGALGPLFARMFEWFREVKPKADFNEIRKWGIPLTKFKDHLATAAWVKGARSNSRELAAKA